MTTKLVVILLRTKQRGLHQSSLMKAALVLARDSSLLTRRSLLHFRLLPFCFRLLHGRDVLARARGDDAEAADLAAVRAAARGAQLAHERGSFLVREARGLAPALAQHGPEPFVECTHPQTFRRPVLVLWRLHGKCNGLAKARTSAPPHARLRAARVRR